MKKSILLLYAVIFPLIAYSGERAAKNVAPRHERAAVKQIPSQDKQTKSGRPSVSKRTAESNEKRIVKRARTVTKPVGPIVASSKPPQPKEGIAIPSKEQFIITNQPATEPQEPEPKRKPVPAGRQQTKSVKQRQARQPSAAQRKAKKSSSLFPENEMESERGEQSSSRKIAQSAAQLPVTAKKMPRKRVATENPYPLPKRVDLSHIEGKGIGYSAGYTRLDLLLAPDYKAEGFLPMIDLNGLRFNDNTYAANVGFVGRYLTNSLCEILGGNIYYDYRQGVRGDYHQLGVGLEVIGKRWDFRANAYVPFGVKRHTTKCVFDDYIGPYCATKRENEFAAYTYNAEIGYQLINSNTFPLYIAVGPYYFSGEFDTTAMGGKVRLRPQYKDYIALDLSFSHDNVFGSIFQVEVIFSLPLYQLSYIKDKKGPCGISNRKVYQPVERFWVMPLSERCCWKANF